MEPIFAEIPTVTPINAIFSEQAGKQLITLGTVVGTPPTNGGFFAVNCILQDTSSGAGTLVWDNVGSVDTPVWQLLGGGGSETVVKIGEIDFNDLNSSSSVTFTGAKPVGKYFAGAFLRTTETFVSYSGSIIYSLGNGSGKRTWVTVSVSSYSVTPDNYSLNQAGRRLASSQLASELASSDITAGGISISDTQDIVVQLGLSNDSQDWSAGTMEVWCVFKDFPF